MITDKTGLVADYDSDAANALRTRRAAARGDARTALSHKRTTRHPSRRSSRVTYRSRSSVRAIFVTHQSVLLGNISRMLRRPRSFHAFPCHMSPSTNTATRRACHTMSGRPSTSRACNRYRRPRLCNSRRKAISALESWLRTAAIMREVSAGSRRRVAKSRLGINIRRSLGRSSSCLSRVGFAQCQKLPQPSLRISRSSSLLEASGPRSAGMQSVPPGQ